MLNHGNREYSQFRSQRCVFRALLATPGVVNDRRVTTGRQVSGDAVACTFRETHSSGKTWGKTRGRPRGTKKNSHARVVVSKSTGERSLTRFSFAFICTDFLRFLRASRLNAYPVFIFFKFFFIIIISFRYDCSTGSRGRFSGERAEVSGETSGESEPMATGAETSL